MGVRTTISDDRIGASDSASVFSVKGNIGSNNRFDFTDRGATSSALQLVGDFGEIYAQNLGNVYAKANETTSALTDKTLAALGKLTGENTEGGQNKMFVYLALGALAAVAYILTKRPK